MNLGSQFAKAAMTSCLVWLSFCGLHMPQPARRLGGRRRL